MKKLRPNIKITAIGHTSINVWVPWYVLFHTMKERGLSVSEFLKAQDVHQAPFLYDLLECSLENGIRR